MYVSAMVVLHYGWLSHAACTVHCRCAVMFYGADGSAANAASPTRRCYVPLSSCRTSVSKWTLSAAFS